MLLIFRILLIASTLLYLNACSDSRTRVASGPGTNDASSEAPQDGQDTFDDSGSTDSDTNDNEAPPQDATDPIEEEPEDALNSTSANSIIEQAFNVLSGEVYDRRLLAFPYLTTEELGPATGTTSSFRYLSLECENLGTVQQTLSTVNELKVNNSFFSDCAIRDDVLNGRVVIRQNSDCCGYQLSFSDNFVVTYQPNGVMEVKGSFAYNPTDSEVREFSVDEMNYYLSNSEGSLKITNADTTRFFAINGQAVNGVGVSGMSGRFTMLSNLLEAIPMNVTITEPFVNTNSITDRSYDRGEMRISSDAGEIVLNADNGNADTVDVTITSAEGSVSQTVMNWSTWIDALSFVPARLL